MWLQGLLLLYFLVDSEGQTTDGRNIFQVAADERVNNDLREPCDRDNYPASYDFIIVGAGAAGCVLASRLTENPKVTVLLIEAGQPEPAVTAVPAFCFDLRKTDIDWGFSSEPNANYCRAMDDGRCPFPRGKCMGGSTAMNNAISSRGNRRDYDKWADLGNKGWDYNSTRLYFKKLENMKIPDFQSDTFYHGHNGPIEINRRYEHPLLPVVIEAGRETNWPTYNDFNNAATQIGFSFTQNVIKDGARLSASRAYLHPHLDRPNLYVVKYALARKILFSTETHASGVTYEKNNELFNVYARKEVLVCAGAIKSPQLLMLSGIGPRKHLEEMGISPIVADLPVGENLQDHVGVMGITYETNVTNPATDMDALVDLWRKKRIGPLTSFIADMALIDTTQPGKPDGWADIEIIVLYTDNNPSILRDVVGLSQQTSNELYPQPSPNHILLTLAPILLRPESRGEILLRDTNPDSKPLIYPNYWSETKDLETMVRGVRETLKLGDTAAFRALNATLRTQRPSRCTEPFMSDSYIRCLCKELTVTIYHYVGTCSMGTVVDEHLKVNGISGLRVVDASVMPTVPTGHTMIPTYMLAEKTADQIKGEWGLSCSKLSHNLKHWHNVRPIKSCVKQCLATNNGARPI